MLKKNLLLTTMLFGSLGSVAVAAENNAPSAAQVKLEDLASESFFIGTVHPKVMDQQTADVYGDFLTRFRTAFVIMHTTCNMISFGPEKALSGLEELKTVVDPSFTRFINLTPDNREIIEKDLATLLVACQQKYQEHAEANQKLVDALRDMLLKTEIKK
jgi:hypothetical protein